MYAVASTTVESGVFYFVLYILLILRWLFTVRPFSTCFLARFRCERLPAGLLPKLGAISRTLEVVQRLLASVTFPVSVVFNYIFTSIANPVSFFIPCMDDRRSRETSI